MATKKKGLGVKAQGLEALIPTKIAEYKEIEAKNNGHALELDINLIEPNREQPRSRFDEEKLEELASSIRSYGIIEPILVRKNGDYYDLIAGERRWRAAKIVGLKTIPVVIKDWEDSIAFEAALVENIQRENLNPMEEAESYQRLQKEFSYSQEEIAKKVGKSRSAVANSMRLLQLDERVRNFVIENKLSAGHARTLLAVEDGQLQFDLAEHVLEEGLSVRATESLVKAALEPKKEKEQVEPKIDNVTVKAVEDTLKTIFATKVKISQKKNKGKIEIEYYSEEDLDRLLTLMKKMEK